MGETPTVALILPVFNERLIIADALKHLASLGADELIVVDGHSEDGTTQIVRGLPSVLFFEERRGRAFQMNRGAREAHSEVLLFAHADMRFPPRAVTLIRERIQKGYIGGGFQKVYTPSNMLLHLSEIYLNRFYLRGFKRFVGTNAIFVKKDIFMKMQGFSEVPFLEDMIFTEKLRARGSLAVIHEPVFVSSRRYQKRGVLNQMIRNSSILFRYKVLGEDPSRLNAIYEK